MHFFNILKNYNKNLSRRYPIPTPYTNILALFLVKYLFKPAALDPNLKLSKEIKLEKRVKLLVRKSFLAKLRGLVALKNNFCLLKAWKP